MDYYDECLKKLEQMLHEELFDEAAKLIDEELKMPYIPNYFEEKLIQFKKMIPLTDTSNQMSDEKIYDFFKKDEAHQLMAIQALQKRNLRMYSDSIQEWFDEAKSELVVLSLTEICISQRLNEEYTIVKNGLEIRFVPSVCAHPSESNGVEASLTYLKEWLCQENPSFYQLCVECVFKEAFLRLPFDIEEEESEAMAFAIVMYVADLMKYENEMKKLLSEKNASQKGCFELLLYSNII